MFSLNSVINSFRGSLFRGCLTGIKPDRLMRGSLVVPQCFYSEVSNKVDDFDIRPCDDLSKFFQMSPSATLMKSIHRFPIPKGDCGIIGKILDAVRRYSDYFPDCRVAHELYSSGEIADLFLKVEFKKPVQGGQGSLG